MDTVVQLGGGVLLSVVFIALARSQGRRVELLGVALFGGLGALGVRRWPMLLAVGWAAHVAWDLLVADASATGYVPAWYPTLCVGTDLFLAGYIAGLVWPGRPSGDLPRPA